MKTLIEMQRETWDKYAEWNDIQPGQEIGASKALIYSIVEKAWMAGRREGYKEGVAAVDKVLKDAKGL